MGNANSSAASPAHRKAVDAEVAKNDLPALVTRMEEALEALNARVSRLEADEAGRNAQLSSLQRSLPECQSQAERATE